MSGRWLGIVCWTIVMGMLVLVCDAAGPTIGPVRSPRVPLSIPPAKDAAVTDEEIGQSIQKAVDVMLSLYRDGQLALLPAKSTFTDEGGEVRRSGDTRDREQDWANVTGLNALTLYALLQAGMAVPDKRLDPRGEFIKLAIEKVKAGRTSGFPETYARALRATALAVHNRPEDRKALEADVQWLLRVGANGRYGYDAERTRAAWDNSNTQYGLLGVWAGAEVGVEVPEKYWQAMQAHWTSVQLRDGQWGYAQGPRQAGLAMTCAGLASLFVTWDYIEAPRVAATVGRDPFSPALARGLAWLEKGDNAIDLDPNGVMWFPGYNLYGLERVGLASGLKYFGKHDWYRVLARRVVDAQLKNGLWSGLPPATGMMYRELGDSDGKVMGQVHLQDTAYLVLFLARGRHPIIMNKLRYDGAWSNRPRDLSNLARFAGRAMERPLNWQVVSIDRDWTDWTDAPILFLASHAATKFTDEQVRKLRDYVLNGGLLFLHADGGASAFDASARELAARVVPEHEMQDLPGDHAIYNVLYKPEPRPPLKAVSNGSRLLIVYSPQDLSIAWQTRSEKSRRSSFEVGVNLFLYAAGKTDLRNRLASSYLPPLPPARRYAVKLGRVKYAGAWDPEPAAHVRFSRYFTRQTSWDLDVVPIAAESLDFTATPVAHLTGTAPHKFTDAEIAAVRAYVEAGGVLIVDCCGGSTDFAKSAQDLLTAAFGKQTQVMAADHAALAAGGACMADVSKPVLRPQAARAFGSLRRPEMLLAGKGAVFFTPLDMTTGLLGTNTWGVFGFEPNYAQLLLKNLILWAADRPSR